MTNSCVNKYSNGFTFDPASWELRDVTGGYEKITSLPQVLQCSYCGSLHPNEAVKFLKQPGTMFSGSDWKYGWPHKFYIEPLNPESDRELKVGESSEKDGNGGWIRKPIMGTVKHLHFKFYNDHLKDAEEDVFKEFSELSSKLFGIEWGKNEKGLFYKAPSTNSFYGYQQAGEITANGVIQKSL